MLKDDNPTLVFSSKKEVSNKEVIITDPKNVLPKIMSELYKKNIQSLIVEGGTKTIQHFIDNNLWDEARTIISPKEIINGIKSPILSGKVKSRLQIEKDVIQISIPFPKKGF
jgi:diaminohydroxyphosphoribosylaminopyrimidine deaminase/5-amino-6-(5-phosphoribosylamino)uracil reductase